MQEISLSWQINLFPLQIVETYTYILKVHLFKAWTFQKGLANISVGINNQCHQRNIGHSSIHSIIYLTSIYIRVHKLVANELH